MRILLDNNVNVRFSRLLTGHEVIHARQAGWRQLVNGHLIQAAEEAGFDAIVTADKSMRYQQNIRERRISVIVLNSLFIRLDSIAPLAPQVQALLDGGLPAGSFVVAGP